MAEKSIADTIIDNYTYTKDWKRSNKKYIGEENSWTIPSQPKALTTEFIDIDRYYNHYNVVSPRVDIEFRTGDGENDWTSLKQLVTDDGSFVYSATIERVNENNTKTVSEKEVKMKDGVYKIDEKEVKVGDEINGGKIIAINKDSKNNNNNYFVSATIEDTGFRTLQLDLFDRTFTTIQAMLFDAIKYASSQETEGNKKTANSNTSFDLEFVKMPALTRNNIRIRYGFNDNVNITVPEGYWNEAGLNSNFYKGDDKYRWVSRRFNDKEKSSGLTEGEASESGAVDQNVSFDNVLYYLNNQSTILGGFEEFYITNVQSTLTNTGIKYTITAVGSDALKLNGYKFVQKYANIVDKPKNVLASLMRCFNFSGNGANVVAKNTKQTMLKLVWNDERPLVPIKKILPTKDGYKAYSVDEQKEEVEKDKIVLSNYKEKLIVAQRLLGCLTSEAGNDYIAGDILEQKKLYSDWKLTERIATNGSKYNSDLFNTTIGSPLWFNCYAQIRGVIPNSWDIAKEALFAYYLKNYGTSRISIKLDDGRDESGAAIPIYNCDDPFVDNNSGYTYYACSHGTSFFYSRVARAVLADTIADNVYNFNGASVIEAINQHYLVKSQQLYKIDAAKEIFKILRDYIKNNLIGDKNGNQYYIKLPISFINALNTKAAKKIAKVCFKQREGGARLENIEEGDGWTIFRPADDMFNKLPDGVGNGDRYSEEKEKWANKLFYGLKHKDIKDEDIDKAIKEIDNSEAPEPNTEDSNFDVSTLKNLAVVFSYAIGVAGMTGSSSDNNNMTVSINTNDEQSILLSPDGAKENSKYGYVCFDFASANETYNVSGKYKNGKDIEFTPDGKEGTWVVREFLDEQTKDTDCDNFMKNLNIASLSFKNAYVLEEQAIENNDTWTVLSTEEQLKKIKEEIDKFDDLSSFKVKLSNSSRMDGSFREIDSFNGVRSGTTITRELYERFTRLAPAGHDKDKNRKTLKFKEGDYVNLAKDITKAISKVNDKYKELDKKTRDNESAISSDEITLSLGGPESAVGSSKFYKSVSSLLNEFCNACPPYHDYETEAKRKTEYAKGKKQEDIAEYVDADGNKQTLDLKGEAPTYSLTWDIIGSYKDGNGEIPVVGLHYRIPKRPSKLRVYKWGTGNPDMHAIKNVNISTSSEFALLSSAANSSLKLGIGGEKVAIKGVNSKASTDGSDNGSIVAEYNNYKSTEEPAYFKSIVSENDMHKITDAAFQTINKGSITILGDPSLRFGGYISPMMYPIYLDISLQNEGATWNTNKSTKSTLSGVYVVSKITHSINASGYLTTLEVMRYPGINEVINSLS